MTNYFMMISSQLLCFDSRRKCGVSFIHTQWASSCANVSRQLASSPMGFIICNFLLSISQQHFQTNWCGLYMSPTSKTLCMQQISFVDVLFTTQIVLSRSGHFSGGHTGWNQLQSHHGELQAGPRQLGLEWCFRAVTVMVDCDRVFNSL